MNSLVVAPFAKMSIHGGRNEPYVSGHAQVTFFNSSNRTPPPGQYFFSVHRQGSAVLRESLMTSRAVGLLDDEYVDRFPTYETLVTYTCYDNNGRRELFVAAMMKAAEYEHFSKFLAQHFFANGETRITMPFYGFGKTDQQNGTTEAEFYQGRPQVIFNDEIRYSFNQIGQFKS